MRWFLPTIFTHIINLFSFEEVVVFSFLGFVLLFLLGKILILNLHLGDGPKSFSLLMVLIILFACILITTNQIVGACEFAGEAIQFVGDG